MNTECLICFYPISKEHAVGHCVNCEYRCHKVCYKKWFSKSAGESGACVHCREYESVIYKKPKFSCYKLFGCFCF